jgi:hypothetical protein
VSIGRKRPSARRVRQRRRRRDDATTGAPAADACSAARATASFRALVAKFNLNCISNCRIVLSQPKN